MFIKDQFASRYFRRDKITGSYYHPSSLSCKLSSENDNEVNEVQPQNDNKHEDTISDDSPENENDQTEPEVSISESKPLNRTDLKRIFDEILGSYNRCSENVKFLSVLWQYQQKKFVIAMEDHGE